MRFFDWHELFGRKREFSPAASLALPVATSLPFTPARHRVAVVLHLFHVDLASEIARYLHRIPLPFDLLITTDTVEKRQCISTSPLSVFKGKTAILIVPNRGRDVAPRFIAHAESYKNYDLLLFLHGKKSEHAPLLKPWRHFMFEQLLGSEKLVEDILQLFATFPELGIIAPQHFRDVARDINWGSNWRNARRLAAHMGVSLKHKYPMDFPAGSMFWARPAALFPLLNLHLAYGDFELEAGQTDGTLAHQIERLIYAVCNSQGFYWLTVSNSEFQPRSFPALDVSTLDDIQAIFKREL